MGEFSIAHLLIFGFILLVFFGPSRIPALGQSIGKAIRGFKEGLNEINVEAKDVGPQKEIKAHKDTVSETVSETAKQNTKEKVKTEHKS